MPYSSLPARPDLGQLKKQAKDLLKAYRAGDPRAMLRFRHALPSLADASDEHLAQLSPSLRHAQRVVATEHGFDSWERMKAHISVGTEESPIEMTIDHIRMHPTGGHRVLVLKAKPNDTYLPIWIGPLEAVAIALRLEGQEPPRPMTHDLMDSMISDLGARVARVIVSEFKSYTFFAKVILKRNGTIIESDARTSDAVALAVRTDAPIFVERDVLDRAAVSFDPQTGAPEALGFEWPAVSIDDLGGGFSEEVESILRRASVQTERLGRDEIEPRDILLSLVREVKGLSAMVFAKLGTDIGAIQSALEQVPVQGVHESIAKPDLSEASQRVLRLARDEAYVLFHGCVEVEHLLLGLASVDDDELQGILKENGIGINGARAAVVKLLKGWRPDPSSADLHDSTYSDPG